mmetsp:Transcript_19121/g.44428  ORF Transcript_19121/g.44428 Transcript_19121/m.44428 type:complete len:290 (+) Transcript_19121:1151-2020(+)
MLRYSLPRRFRPTSTTHPPGLSSFRTFEAGEPRLGLRSLRALAAPPPRPPAPSASSPPEGGGGGLNPVVRAVRRSRSLTSSSRPRSTSNKSDRAPSRMPRVTSVSSSRSATISEPRLSLRTCAKRASASADALSYSPDKVSSTSSPPFSQSTTVAVVVPPSLKRYRLLTRSCARAAVDSAPSALASSLFREARFFSRAEAAFSTARVQASCSSTRSAAASSSTSLSTPSSSSSSASPSNSSLLSKTDAFEASQSSPDEGADARSRAGTGRARDGGRHHHHEHPDRGSEP